jgi:hypothetical protein
MYVVVVPSEILSLRVSLMNYGRLLLRFNVGFFALVAAACSAQAANTFKVSGPMTEGGNVRGWKISPPGDYVIYLADEHTNGIDELFTQQIVGGSAHAKLNEPLSGSEEVQDFAVSPLGAQVVFSVGSNFRRHKLFTTATNGSMEPLQLNVIEPTTGESVLWNLSGDGRRVLYSSQFNLFSKLIDGTGPEVRLNPSDTVVQEINTKNLGGLTFFEASPRIHDVYYTSSLYAAPDDGSRPAWKISQDVVTGGGFDFALLFSASPLGDYIVYRGNFDTSDTAQLYSRRIDASLPVNLLNDPVQSNNDVEASFKLSPDGTRTAFQLGDLQLFTVPTDRSFPPVGLAIHTADMMFTADSSRLVFRADQNSDNEFELYSTAVDGSSASLRLNPSSQGTVHRFILTPDNQYAVFLWDPTPTRSDSASLFVAALDGSLPPTPISPLLEPGQQVTSFLYSDSLKSIIYGYDAAVRVGIEVEARTKEIYTVPILGGRPRLISDPLVAGGYIDQMTLSDDGRTIVYSAFQDSVLHKELFGIHLVPETSACLMAVLGALICCRYWRTSELPKRASSV